MNMESNNTNVLKALTIGVAIGTLLGVVLASSNKSSNARNKVLKRNDELKDLVTKKLTTLLEIVKRETEMARLEANAYIHNETDVVLKNSKAIALLEYNTIP